MRACVERQVTRNKKGGNEEEKKDVWVCIHCMSVDRIFDVNVRHHTRFNAAKQIALPRGWIVHGV